MNATSTATPRQRKPNDPVNFTGRLFTGIGTGLADLFDGTAILESQTMPARSPTGAG